MLAPVLGLEYVATPGGGATCNGGPIAPRAVVPLGERLVGTGFSYEQPARTRQAGYLARMLPADPRHPPARLLRPRHLRRGRGAPRRLRRGGAHIWDHAAAGLVVAEAGGTLEVTRSPGGKRLLICAPDDGFAEFREVVVDAGFVHGEGPNGAPTPVDDTGE